MLRSLIAAALALVVLAAAVSVAEAGARVAICANTDLMRPCQAAAAPERPAQRAPGSLKRSARYLAAPVSRALQRASLAVPAVAPAALRGLVDAAATAAGVPLELAHAVIRQESDYNPSLRGRAGEWGIGQIKCETARRVGLAGSCGLLADAAINLRFAMAYLRLALDRGGRGCAGVSLYQSGIGGPLRCSSYGRAVMARAGA